jgi:sterol desaturase/sphingolipid hydroxylase (fatty acid hydroxylase superfamily)
MDIAQTAALVGVAYVSFFLLERALPLRRPKASLPYRVLVNIALSATAFATTALLVEPAANAMLGYSEAGSIGLIPLLGLGDAAGIVAAFLLLDLTFYYWHVANHRIRFLWRFHNVHHIDPDLDVSTAFRFHFVEVALSAVFRVAQVALIGPSLAAYAIYEVAFQLGTLFHHSNVCLPLSFERALNLLFVTPRMHGIHHSDIKEENFSNWSVVLSWWDRLHGTLRLDVPQAEVNIGIPAYSDPADNRLRRCFLLPFKAQRDYWSGAHGKRLVREPQASAATGSLAP